MRRLAAVTSLPALAGLVAISAAHAAPSNVTRLPGPPDGVAFEIAFAPPALDTVQVAGRSFIAPSVDLCAEISPAGAPDLPARLLMAAVPEGARITVTAERLEERILSPLPPAPVPRQERTGRRDDGSWIVEDIPEPDPAVYGAAYPPAAAWIFAESRVRDLPVVRIAVSPLRHDPQRGTSFAPRVRVEVRWSGGMIRPAPEVDAVFGAQYQILLVNPEDAARFRTIADKAPRKTAEGDYFGSSPNGWTKVFVNARGFHRISYSALQSAGVAVTSLDPSTVRLFNGGGLYLDEHTDVASLPGWMEEVAVRVEDADGDGVFEAGDGIVFFGQGVDGWADDYGLQMTRQRWIENEYTSENVYWLTWGGTWSDPPRRIAALDAPPAGGVVTRSFRDRVHYERNREFDSAPYRAGYRWERFWYQLLADGDPARAFGAVLADPDTTEEMQLWARFWGANSSIGYLPDHFLRITMNGQLVAERSWNWQGLQDVQDVIVTGAWGRRNNTMTVIVPTMADTTNANRRDLIWLAWYEMDYTHRLRAPDGVLEFASPATLDPVTMAVTGLAAGGSHGLFDVTDRFAPVELTGVTVSASSDGDSLAFAVTPNGVSRRLVLVRPTKYLAPRLARDSAPALYLRDRDDRVDYIIVTHPSFSDAAARLRDLRQTRIEGIEDPRAAVVSVEDIYDEFSWGLPDASAIRNFLEWAYDRWNGGDPGRHPTYALLLGDASFDPRDFDQDGAKSYVLAYENARGVYFGEGTPQYVTDDWFSFFDGPNDQTADLFTGRLPAATASEAGVLVDKTIRYETQPDRSGWSLRAILAADDLCQAGRNDGLGVTHIRQTENLDRYYLPRPIDRVKVYLTEYGTSCSILQKPSAQADLLRRVDEGAWILNFAGHGGALQLADEQLLIRQNVASMRNADRLLFFITASCIVGKFDSQEVGLGEAMIKHPGGGSVVTFAATQLASAGDNELLNNTVMRLLFPRGNALCDTMTTIGFATVTAKNVIQRGTSYNYVLQGDPAVRLAVPRLRVDLARTDPPGARAAAPRDTLLRGELVSVHGVVRRPDGGVAIDFNGRANVLAADSEVLRKPSPGDPTGNYYMPGAPVYRGDLPVTRGEFDATFVVPKVLSSEERGLGRIRVHVTSASIEGAGVIDSLYMSTQSVSSADTTGPVIAFADFTGGSLRAGDQVRLTLEDPSGINITQIQQSRAVTVTVEDKFGTSVLVTDLTPQLVFVDGYQRGEVVYTVPGRPTLSPGQIYTLAARASDSQNNLSILRQDFTFVVESGFRIKQAYAFPSPTSGETRIFFEPTSDAGEVTVKILTVAGRTVRTLRGMVARSGWQAEPVLWDGRDEEGDLVANGVYFFKIEARASEGDGRATVIGKAVVLR